MNKVCPGLRFVASYSGGKDSVLAIHRASVSYTHLTLPTTSRV